MVKKIFAYALMALLLLSFIASSLVEAAEPASPAISAPAKKKLHFVEPSLLRDLFSMQKQMARMNEGEQLQMRVYLQIIPSLSRTEPRSSQEVQTHKNGVLKHARILLDQLKVKYAAPKAAH